MQRAIKTEGDRGVTSMSQDRRNDKLKIMTKKCSSVLDEEDGNE